MNPLMKERIVAIFAQLDVDEGNRKRAEEDPEACILSLLTHVEDELRHYSFVFRDAAYTENVNAARTLLG
jgi:hypothetical protein